MKSSSKTKADPTCFRFGERLALEVPVRLAVNGRPLGRGTIRNASLSGALIETPLDLPQYTNLVLTLAITEGSRLATRELNAQVVRLDPAGFGIEWRDMASVDITDLLARASKDDTSA